MEIIKDNIDKLNAEVVIKLKEDDYKSNVEKVLRDYQKKARINGFRPGKVPMGVIQKMYGESILVSEVNKMISKSLYEYLHENKIEVLGTPLPKSKETEKVNWKTQKDFEFTYEMGLSPEINIKLANEKISKHSVANDLKLTEKYIEYLQKRFGTQKEVEISEIDDLIYGTLVELDESNEPKDGGISKQDVPIAPNTVEDNEAKKLFLGKKVGESIVVDPKKIANNPTVIASMLGINKDLAENFTSMLSFTITKISRLSEAVLNQEFYNNVYGKDVIKSDSDFNKKASEEAHKMIMAEGEKKFNNDVIKKALERTKVPLPNEFLKRWLISSNEKPITMEQVDLEYDGFAKNTRWQLIKNQIVKENELKVSEEELVNEAKNFVKNQYAQYGQLQIGEKELADIASKIVSNEEERKSILERLYEFKVVEYLKSILKIKEVDVSYDEFVKLANQEDKKSESAFAKFFKSGFKKKS